MQCNAVSMLSYEYLVCCHRLSDGDKQVSLTLGSSSVVFATSLLKEKKSDPMLTYSYLQVIYTNPKVTYSYPQVIYSGTKVML